MGINRILPYMQSTFHQVLPWFMRPHTGSLQVTTYFSTDNIAYRILFTAFTTFSTVNPNFSNSKSAGADAPNPCMVTYAPSRPTYFPQPKSLKASTATRARTCFGSTESLYSWLWLSNTSIEGILTTRMKQWTNRQ